MNLKKIKLKLYNKGTLSYPIFEIIISKLKKKGNLEKIGIYSPLNNIIFINTYRLAY
jgi:ribosomal protein S16